MAVKANKRAKWLAYFLDSSNTATFLNRTESARAAGYKTNKEDSLRNIGYQNFTKLSKEIEKWLDESGLSENALKIRMIRLLDAKETKFFQHEGLVTEEREVEALETQRRTLDMALKVRGLYAPEKREHTGKDGGPIEVATLSDTERAVRIKAILDAARTRRNGQNAD